MGNNMFKAKGSRKGDFVESMDDSTRYYKVWPSDGDRPGRCVAEPGIDRKASDYIARVKASSSSSSGDD
ncbi:hypothetical protein Vadar_005186 [Vaccinium darrowii]|uniref:Uncharacterized protein n=1 Tax=Vaccinium darrowii TaxID=229202 RepID=A0ACB7ZHM9_9ERIC|nr:hypothetical protein Vadar_005186 [Vaccinium darrowii]